MSIYRIFFRKTFLIYSLDSLNDRINHYKQTINHEPIQKNPNPTLILVLFIISQSVGPVLVGFLCFFCCISIFMWHQDCFSKSDVLKNPDRDCVFFTSFVNALYFCETVLFELICRSFFSFKKKKNLLKKRCLFFFSWCFCGFVFIGMWLHL